MSCVMEVSAGCFLMDVMSPLVPQILAFLHLVVIHQDREDGAHTCTYHVSICSLKVLASLLPMLWLLWASQLTWIRFVDSRIVSRS